LGYVNITAEGVAELIEPRIVTLYLQWLNWIARSARRAAYATAARTYLGSSLYVGIFLCLLFYGFRYRAIIASTARRVFTRRAAQRGANTVGRYLSAYVSQESLDRGLQLANAAGQRIGSYITQENAARGIEIGGRVVRAVGSGLSTAGEYAEQLAGRMHQRASTRENAQTSRETLRNYAYPPAARSQSPSR